MNDEGIKQAVELRTHLFDNKTVGVSAKETQLINALRGGKDSEKSVIVTSLLRRAVATTTLALWPRVNNTDEKIIVLISLRSFPATHPLTHSYLIGIIFIARD